MRLSTTLNKKILFVCFWLALWQGISLWVNSPIILPSPVQVAVALGLLVVEKSFWITVATSFLRIASGFALGFCGGVVMAFAGYSRPIIREFFQPLLSVIKAVPVASFIVVLLVWVPTEFLSTVVGVIMVLPLTFENVYGSLSKVDKNMAEMSAVFKVPFMRRLKTLYLPTAMPGIISAVSVGVGFGFKSGVASEVIGICRDTIGGSIYTAKLTLETAQVLAWTVVIVCLSVGTSKLVKYAVTRLEKERGIEN